MVALDGYFDGSIILLVLTYAHVRSAFLLLLSTSQFQKSRDTTEARSDSRICVVIFLFLLINRRGNERNAEHNTFSSALTALQLLIIIALFQLLN